MADLAFGISKTVVQEVAKRVKNAKEEEAKQWQTVERDIVFMKHEFETMQSFLESAAAAGDGEGRFRAGVGRTWVRQVRELSDGAEDCIDYVLHLDKERSVCRRALPCCMRGVLPLDKAVSDIQQLKAMVEDVSKRNMRYSLGGGDCSGSSKLVPVAGHTQLIASSTASASTLDTFVKANEAAKNKDGADNLKALMAVDCKDLRVFSICGTGGHLGTVSILWKFYEDPALCSDFPLRAWVKLTQPFDPLGFVGSLVDQFQANSQQQPGRPIVVPAAHELSPEDLVTKFSGDIRHIKYLIVLEDVLSMAEWDAARAFLPDANNGSRIIVLTHQLEIASICTGTKPPQVSPLREFSPHHSVCVFYQEQQAQADPEAFGEQPPKHTADETTDPQASGKQPAKPTADEITEVMAAETVDAETSGKRLRKLEELITSLVWRDKSLVISVCAGKSSVVKTIYYRCLERQAENKFHNYAWVVVPKNPLDINEFCRRLLCIVEGGSRHNGGNVVSRCQELLSLPRNLIFIDGLQSTADWDLITKELKFSECPKCCIVVVTKEESVAQHCASDRSLVFNISDQAYLAPHSLQYQRDDDDNKNYFMMRPKGSSRLAKAYDWLRDNPLVARDSCEEKRLQKLITSPDRRGKHQVISVCGIAGAGKSFVVKTMYYRCMQLEMVDDLFCDYVWVDVPHPFEIMEFCRRLFFAWTGIKDKEDVHLMDACLRLLSDERRRVLVVIDGLRSTDDWDSIKADLRLATSPSCILVVTRDPTVARHCATTEDTICSITSLQEDAMRRHIIAQIGTFEQQDPKMTNEELEKLTRQSLAIMNKCGRSPEVLSALLSYYLAFKQDAAKIAALERLNGNFMQELRANPDLGRLRTVFTSVHSNIHACPQVIKKCIFYLSIFRQGSSIIRRDRLVRRWIAEGYSEGIDSISMAVYTETNLFDKIGELGMITKPAAAQSSTGAAVNSSGTMRMSSCQINSFFLEYITMRETEESIFLPLEVTVLEAGRSPPKTHHVGQHLAIRKWKGEKAVFDCLDFTRLRSLTVSGQWQPFFVSDMMLALRVLDLEGTESNLSDGDLKQIVEKLPRLKFLSLRRCREITRLPRSVGGLRQLQTLDVRGTKIVRLPGSIVKLQKLQYLRAGTTGDGQGGIRVPKGIRALKALHTLGAIDLSSSCAGMAILNKLHRLQQLRKLHVSGINKWHNSLCACVACRRRSIGFPTNSFGELKVLEIACSPGMRVQFAQGAVPKLEKVKLYWRHEPLPEFTGLELLKSSLGQIWIKGPGHDTVSANLLAELNQTTNNQISHGSQPESSLPEGQQKLESIEGIQEESNPAAGNQHISKSSQAHSPKFSGPKFQTSLLKQMLLKGTCCNAVRNKAQSQRSQPEPSRASEVIQDIPKSSQAEGKEQKSDSSQAQGQFEPPIAQGHGSQPEPSLAEGIEGKQHKPDSSQAQGQNEQAKQIWVSSQAERNGQGWICLSKSLLVPGPGSDRLKDTTLLEEASEEHYLD